MPHDALSIFDRRTGAWFEKTLGAPTRVQEEAWPAIASGADTLVSAPTGTGKTLSAFLVFLDRLKGLARAGALRDELHLLYISPLKSLAGDIRENLRRPLDGISAGDGAPFDLCVAVRTGDTAQRERRAMVKKPPHILITTPESLYLLLTSESGRGMLKTARAVIIDELHALIGSKRGTHLMLSLARLDALRGAPLQRIGLSATVRPLGTAAQYLSPGGAAVIVPAMEKAAQLRVTSPLPDWRVLPRGSVWPELARAVYEQCREARSVIAFVEGRQFAEKLAYYVNQLAGEGFARTHHGSVSKEQRLEVEDALRAGGLKLLCATSSMELGIDVGDIDRVVQIGCPRSISGTLQRLGRAGHNPGRVSVMHIFPRTAGEGLHCGLTAQLAREGAVEALAPPEGCLDVLAQHLVSMACGGGYSLDEVMRLLPRAYPFRDTRREDVQAVLEMLAGDYEHRRDVPARPRVLYDRINGRVEGDAYSRLLASGTGGTIPDRGLYAVRSESGAKLGELEEEFVFEARVGDKFLLGSFAWRITGMTKDAVMVEQAGTEGAQPPFWRGDWSGRPLETQLRFGRLMRELREASEAGALPGALRALGLDDTALEGAGGYITRQIEATGTLPDDRTVIVEHFRDDAGDEQIMVHAMLGRRVNAPLGLLAQHTAGRLTGMDVGGFDDEDGFLLYPLSKGELPRGLLSAIDPETARGILETLLPATPVFGMSFRYNAARALMMGVKKAGRQPLWIQRMKGASLLDAVIEYPQHPLIRETRRECLNDFWDLDGVVWALRGIRSGAITVREVWSEEPSPFSLPLRRQAESVLLYEYSPTTKRVRRAAGEAARIDGMIKPEAALLQRVSARRRAPEDMNGLHSLLMMEGDLLAGEAQFPAEWLTELAARGRAVYIEPGLWIAAEQAGEYAAALEEGDADARRSIVRRALRYRGGMSGEALAERYFWDAGEAQTVLDALAEHKSAVEEGGTYYHAELYGRAVRETVAARRERIRTLPPERYAALLAERVRVPGTPEEQVSAAVTALFGEEYPAALWEEVILPARVAGYRPALLDAALASGEFFWRMSPEGTVAFHPYADTDRDFDASYEGVDENGAQLLEALSKWGASFAHLLPAFPDVPQYDVLSELMQKGYVHADSFAPVRELIRRAETDRMSAKRRACSRVLAASGGRWERCRRLRALTPEELVERAFDRAALLCRETVRGIGWGAALEVLRVWELTGRARRGYFIEGMSGAQFLREREFEGVTLSLASPRGGVLWLSAADPAQAWGRCLRRREDRPFINVPGTAVALEAGETRAVFERYGQSLRVFDGRGLDEALKAFARDFAQKRIFPQRTRITVKRYPAEAEEPLRAAGFMRSMNDFVLYRNR